MTNGLIWLREPALLFRYGQAVEDPRDGLTLFGPLDEGKTYGIRFGVVGTTPSIDRFIRWVERINQPILNDPATNPRPSFPGFEAVFHIPWRPAPIIRKVIREQDLDVAVLQSDRHRRVFATVDVFADPILNAIREEESQVDLWFVVIPEKVYKYCRPLSNVERAVRIVSKETMRPANARNLLSSPSLFASVNEAATPYHYEPHFHHQLKARLLQARAVTQILREQTITNPEEFNRQAEQKTWAKMRSQIAWNVSSATFYKAGARPWKLARVRDGVCYVGLVFKQDENSRDPRNACCAAQMFLDSGDGIVFKGAVGPWYNPQRGDFNLSSDAARELVALAVSSYAEKHGSPPAELFIHGRVRFADDEWAGFTDAVDGQTKLIGVQIADAQRMKLFSSKNTPVLRGCAQLLDPVSAYLWTRGFIPRLKTYPGMEVPNPLYVRIARGECEIETVLRDVLALTKLNYNGCSYADGAPVTLKFADAVGEILTAGPLSGIPPLPFKHYF